MNRGIGTPQNELTHFTCMGCEFVIRGANTRAFCVLNQSLPNGEIPIDIRLAGTLDSLRIIPIIEQRILKGMLHPYQEGACSYHSEWMKIEEMRGFEQTLTDWKEKPVDDWGLSVRVSNIIKSEKFTLLEIIEMGQKKFRSRVKQMGPKSVLEIKLFLKCIGVIWKE